MLNCKAIKPSERKVKRMITIRNSALTAKISEHGAELQSLALHGEEYMWSADPKYWGKTAPIMFPMCGGLKEGRYELFGKSYSMSKHGFARNMDFTVSSVSETSVTLTLFDTPETREIYPFSFAFSVTYMLNGDSLAVTYDVENKGADTMYATFGAHEGYACPEGIEAYDIVFPEPETLYASGLNGEIVTDYYKLMMTERCSFPLRDSDFAIDALVFRAIKNKSVSLLNRKTARGVKVDFQGFDNLVLWHKYGAPYLCIEPWCGLPDITGTGFDFTQKEGMRRIEPSRHFTRTHTITPLI